MEFLINRLQGIQVEHFLLCGGGPEVHHGNLGLHVREFHLLALHSGEFHVNVADFFGLPDLGRKFHLVNTSFGLFFKGFHVLGVRINGLEGVRDALHEKTVRGLGEYRKSIIEFLEKDRNNGKGMGMRHNILHPVAVVLYVPAGNGGVSAEGICDNAGNVPYTGVVGVLHLLKVETFLRALHLIRAKGIGFHNHGIPFLKKEGCHLAVLVIEVDELRLGLRDGKLIRECAFGIRLQGIQHLETIHVQELYYKFLLRAVLEDAVYAGLVPVAGEKRGKEDGAKRYAAAKAFHIRQGFWRRFPSSPEAQAAALPCGNPCLLLSGEAQGGYGCEALPCQARLRLPSCRERRP